MAMSRRELVLLDQGDASGEKGRVSSLGEAEVARTRPVVSARSGHFDTAPAQQRCHGENVYLVKRMVEAWNAEDSEGL
jgi:hypothetical protein